MKHSYLRNYPIISELDNHVSFSLVTKVCELVDNWGAMVASFFTLDCSLYGDFFKQRYREVEYYYNGNKKKCWSDTMKILCILIHCDFLD